MSNRVTQVERWIWVLLYGGLLVLCLALAVGRGHAVLAWSLGTGGVAAAVAGLVLIVVRSRMTPK